MIHVHQIIFIFFQEKHDIDEIAVPYTGIVQNETHAFKDDMSSSTLVLNTNFTGKKIIRCEYNMADYTTCKYTKHIKFAGMKERNPYQTRAKHQMQFLFIV